MSKLCLYCLTKGIKCTGSDAVESDTITLLREHGADIVVGATSQAAIIADLVVYSASISKDCPELANPSKMERKEFLSMMCKDFNNVTVISGAHGKTTASAMLSWLYKVNSKPFCANIGGDVIGLDSDDTVAGGENLILEGCEYNRSFLALRPDIGIILNLDYDHPDTYKDFSEVVEAFAKFKDNSRRCIIYEDALNMLCEGDANDRRIISAGRDIRNDYCICNIEYERGKYTFDILAYGEYFGSFSLHTYNEALLSGAVCVIAAAYECGFSSSEVAYGLSSFLGVKKRFECLGRVVNGAKTINDYAHHPQEIAALITCARKLPHDRLVLVFEPHTYSRTKALLQEFAQVLARADIVLIMPVFAARETPDMGATAYELFSEIVAKGGKAIYSTGYTETKEQLEKLCCKDDLVLLVGAGIEPKRLIGN